MAAAAAGAKAGATLAIVGDLFLTADLTSEQAADAAFAPIREAAFSFANLEAPVTEGGAPSEKWITMQMAPAQLENLHALGFDVFTIANNHMMDYGYEGFADTLRHLRAAGFPYVGGGEDLGAAWAAQVVEIGERRVALLGGASTLGATLPATDERPGVAPVRINESYAIDANASLEQPGGALTCIRAPGRPMLSGHARPSRPPERTPISWSSPCIGACRRSGARAFRMGWPNTR